ncbi:ribonuclease BN (tRNA processing enzyme) [Catenulispora sp. MAP5-51]|uniref:MBL fold metallo-hydrolase n=1 Tax=Catenulispora sp. MAP5-51 TaxID=3156298 RepID=UPI0035141A39
MCDVLSSAYGTTGTDRRRFLQILGGTTAASALMTGTASADSKPHPDAAPRPHGRTRIIPLGTAGGPTIMNPARAGTSTAIVYQDQVYLVDLGLGAYQRLVRSGINSELTSVGNTLGNVCGIFFTHLHSDHVADWPGLYWTAGSNSIGRTAPPIRVWGPGSRQSLPRVFPPGRTAPPVVDPADPTPGTTAMTTYLRQAFAADLNDRARDGSAPDPGGLFQIQDIDLSGIWTPDPGGSPPRLSAPIPVWRDGDVTVTATLVDHHPTAPAFAYRFDTPDGSVVVSGDTTVSENLIDLARDTDYLVHEVIDTEFVDRVVGTLPPAQAGPLRAHLLGSHTTIEQVGAAVAEPARARNLVLTHLVPADNPLERWHLAQRGYSGRVTVAADLRAITVGSSAVDGG